MSTVVTDVGKQWISDKLEELNSDVNLYVGWGSGAGTPGAGDTDLFTPESESRVLATRSRPSANVIQWVATLAAAGVKTITNAGLFSAATGPKLLLHGNHTGRALQIGDTIQYTFQLTLP